MVTHRYADLLKGFADARDNTPGLREPHKECLCQACKDYWEGWSAGVKDNVRDILKH